MRLAIDARRRITAEKGPADQGVSAFRRLSVCAVLCLLIAGLPRPAVSATILGELSLEIPEDSRVTADARPRDGRLSLQVSGNSSGLTRALSIAAHPLIETWAVVPRSQGTESVELRLADGVRGVELSRPAPNTLVLTFTDSPLASDAQAARAKQATAARDAILNEQRDNPLRSILLEPLEPVPTVASLGPFRWPMGQTSPVRMAPAQIVPPLPFGSVPSMVRKAWQADPRFNGAIQLAEIGKIDEAVAKLWKIKIGDDPSRALLSLARAHVWSRPAPSGEPTQADWAAEAYLAAVGTYPEASWAAWARGQAAYNLWRDMRLSDAVLQARAAGLTAPRHPDRPWWEMVAAYAMIARGQIDDGLATLAAFADGLPELDLRARFEARKAAATALWRVGDPARAARVVDLLLEKHPGLAGDPDLDRDFVRIYLDAGRLDGARPRLERMKTEGAQKIDRERARWWLTELALFEQNAEEARDLLHEFIDRHPGSVLAPIARMRLAILAALARTDRIDAMGGETPPPWPALSLDLRQVALRWPRTPIEDEALSTVAQIWLANDLIGDGLELMDWSAFRRSENGGPTDHHALVCEHAPKLVEALVTRGENLRALGRFRRHLDSEAFDHCVDMELDEMLIEAALEVGLPELAIRRITRVAARGAAPEVLGAQLVRLARLQSREGRHRVAERTLDFIRSRELPVKEGLVELVQADLDIIGGRWEDALESFDYAEAQGAPEAVVLEGRSRAYELGGDYRRAADMLTRAVDAGELEESSDAFLRLADLRRRNAVDPADWESVLEALDRSDTTGRTSDWIRADALLELGRTAELPPVLERLTSETDAFGHWARELTSESKFEVDLEELLDTTSIP